MKDIHVFEVYTSEWRQEWGLDISKERKAPKMVVRGVDRRPSSEIGVSM